MKKQTHLDAIIIGAGPAGLTVAKDMKAAGIVARVYDKGPIASHIYEYPTFMAFHSTRDNVSLGGLPLTIPEDKPTRQQYCRYLVDFVRHFDLDVETYTEISDVRREADGMFAVTKRQRDHQTEVIHAPIVVCAVGAWENPRRLKVPGDNLEKVRYRFTDAHEYVGKKVLVVGGRNSALETGLTLWRGGADVTIVHRGDNFHGRGVKYWLSPDMENRIKAGQITGYLESLVTEIRPETVDINTKSGEIVTIENDFVLPQIGYHPPVEFLRHIGLNLSDEESRPDHNPETLESTVPGLFVAGVIAAGDVSGHIFIENARDHGALIVPRAKQLLLETRNRSEAPAS